MQLARPGSSCPSLTRMQTSLRNPCCACLHTPALGAWAIPTKQRSGRARSRRNAQARSWQGPRCVPFGSPRLDVNPRRRCHHQTEAAHHRPPGRRSAGGPASSAGPGMARRAL